MRYLQTFAEFIEILTQRNSEQQKRNRRQFLANIKKKQFAILLTFEDPVNSKETHLLLEHEQYKQFKKTNNRYAYHPENLDIPVKAHYHIYPSNSKQELYAVNVDDGSAHHKIHRGYKIPKKEADELRALGVKIQDSNLLEGFGYDFKEEIVGEYLTVLLIIDED